MASKKNIAKYDAALERCRKNIEKTKGYIEYHKKMLRVFEAKESKLLAKLEDQKIAALRKSINLSGLDIDELCNAVANGDFGGAAPVESRRIQITIQTVILTVPFSAQKRRVRYEKNKCGKGI